MTFPTRRIAFASLPTPPPALQGTTGVGFRANFLPGAPVSVRSDGAVAFPMFQPELGALVKVGKSTFLGGRISATSIGLGVQAPRGSLYPHHDAFTLELAIGGGHDFHFTELFGMSLSGEFGAGSASLTHATTDFRLHDAHFVPVGRGTLGLFVTPGKFRIYAGGTVGSTVLNDEAGTLTRVCQFDCSTSETGRFDVTVMGLVGGGVRWQGSDLVSVAAELWVPLTGLQRIPPVISITLRVGDLGTSPPKPAPLPPPPPPPSVTPDPEQPPVQL